MSRWKVPSFLLSLIVLLVACSNSIGIGDPLQHLGIYKFPDGYSLYVEEDNGFVIYKLIDSNQRELLRSGKKASVYQKWMLIWDGKSLWFASSDIGGTVWTSGDGGIFVEKRISESGNIYSEAPQAYLEFLRP